MAYANRTQAIYAPISLVDAVDQLDLTVAFSSLHEPAANTIALWADQGTGTYPLTTTRGATDNSTIHIQQGTGIMSTVDRIEFTPNSTNIGLHVDLGTGDLFIDNFNLQAGAAGGDVQGPAGAVDGVLAAFDGVTGKVIKESFVATSAAVVPPIGPIKIVEVDAGADSSVIKGIGTAAAISMNWGDTANTGLIPSCHASIAGQVYGITSCVDSSAGPRIELIRDNTQPELPFQIIADRQYAPIVPGEIPIAVGGNTVLEATSTHVELMGIVDFDAAGGITGVTSINGAPVAAGDVVGPAGAVDERIATFDGVTGKLIQDSGITARVGAGTRNTFITTQTVAADGQNDNLVVGTGGSAGFGVTTAFNCLVCNETGNGAQITGNDNTCLGGRRPGYALTSSNSNTFLGSVTGWQVATGVGENTCVGYAAGSSLDATSARNTVLGSQVEQGVAVNRNNCLLLGHGFQATADNQVRIANGSSAYTSCYVEGIYGSSLLTGDPTADHLATAASSTRIGSSSILAMRNSYSLTVLDSGVTPVYNVLATDEYLLISAGGGVMTVNLPAAVTKRAVNMKKYSGLAVTITPAGGDTILGAPTFVLVSGTAYTFLSDGGTNWWVF